MVLKELIFNSFFFRGDGDMVLKRTDSLQFVLWERVWHSLERTEF